MRLTAFLSARFGLIFQRIIEKLDDFKDELPKLVRKYPKSIGPRVERKTIPLHIATSTVTPGNNSKRLEPAFNKVTLYLAESFWMPPHAYIAYLSCRKKI